MRNLNVGIFHDPELGRELGKTGTKSDIALFNRKTDTCIFSFLCPVDEKPVPKSQIMTEIDVAIISFKDMNPEVGETILMLDDFGISSGIIISPYMNEDQLKALVKGTSLEKFKVLKRDADEIMKYLDRIEPVRDMDGDTIVITDHSFSVKGVGEVMLGFVKKGVLKKHEKLVLLPAGKDIIVRSIQMQDKDCEKAEAGSRVGLAVRGATVNEMKRGSIICKREAVKMSNKIDLQFHANKFYSEGPVEGVFHVTVAMQTVPVTVTNITENRLTIKSEKDIVYTTEDTFLLINLNAKKLHVIGEGKAL